MEKRNLWFGIRFIDGQTIRNKFCEGQEDETA